MKLLNFENQNLKNIRKGTRKKDEFRFYGG